MGSVKEGSGRARQSIVRPNGPWRENALTWMESPRNWRVKMNAVLGSKRVCNGEERKSISFS